mgnify:FL=1
MTKQFTDQLNRTITLREWPPKRIISLVPSQTELLHELGLQAEVVGITKFCVHPETWFRGKTRIGGTKTVNFEKIKALQPDLIIGNKEENEKEQIELLARQYPIWMSDVGNLDQALDMISRVGELTDRPDKAQTLCNTIKTRFAAYHPPSTVYRPPSTAYIIWRKPFMAAGGDTFINSMLNQAGFENVFADKNRYPEITPDELSRADPEFILLSSEPYPFREKHLEQFREICPRAQVVLVDGEMFSWYGSRLLHAPGYFHQLRQSLRLA